MWIVRIALDRPYTFIVLALLILILSPVVILRTPTDIFPSINIPVVAVAWTYTGLNPEEMEGRVTTVYERVLTTLVDNIEHIESTTVNGTAIVKVYLQPNASIDRANAEITAASQTILRQLPPGSLPPLIVNYNASTVPILQLSLSGKGLSYSRKELPHTFDDVDGGRVPCLENGDQGAAFAILPNDIRLRCEAIAYRSYIAKIDDGIAHPLDRKFVEFRNILQVCVDDNVILELIYLGCATWQNELLMAKRRQHVAWRKPLSLHQLRVEIRHHLTRLASVRKRNRSARNGDQLRTQKVQCDVVQLRFGQTIPGETELQNGDGGSVVVDDQGRERSGRQLSENRL